MNIQATERKIYNKVKFLQIPEDEVTSENFGASAYYAGMLDMGKLLIKCHNGELTDEDVRVELAKLDNATKSVN
jgi:hypothetical protein